MERKIETKIVTALMFSHSGNLKLGSNARVRINPLSLPPTPPLRITGSVNQGEVPNRICDFLNVLVFCRWTLSPSYSIKVYDLVGASTQFSVLLLSLRTVLDGGHSNKNFKQTIGLKKVGRV